MGGVCVRKEVRKRKSKRESMYLHMHVEEIYGSVRTPVASACTCGSVINICRISNDPHQVQFLVSFYATVIQYLAKVVQRSHGIGSNFRSVRNLVNIQQGPNAFANLLTKVGIGLGSSASLAHV